MIERYYGLKKIQAIKVYNTAKDLPVMQINSGIKYKP